MEAIVRISSNDNLIDWGATDTDRIIQNVKNILRTRRFEVPFMREMGLSPDHTDNSLNHIKSELEKDIIETVKAYESRANVLEVTIDSIDADGHCDITVKLEV